MSARFDETPGAVRNGVRLERFEVQRTINVTCFEAICVHCGFRGPLVDSPHSNTTYWAVERHVKEVHGHLRGSLGSGKSHDV